MACLRRAGWGGYFFRMDEDPIPDEGHEPEEGGQPDVEWEEAWREMSMEEQDETLEKMLAALTEHRDEIQAKSPETDVDGMIARLAVTLEEQRRRTEQVRETEEAWLQSVANLADAETNLTVMFAEIMKDVENFTEERWAALPVGMRMEMMDQLQEWQQEKGRILSELPIEERRRLE